MPLKLLLFILLCFVSCRAWTADEGASVSLDRRLSVTTENFKGEVAFGLEYGELQSANGENLNAYGPRAHLDYELGHQFSVCPSLSLLQSGSTFVASDIAAYLRYSLSGNLAATRQVLAEDGRAIVTQEPARSSRFAIGLGLEQMLLNGSQSIYPAVGPTVALSYSFSLWRNRFELMGRYSALTSNYQSLDSIFIDLSLLLGI